MSKHLKHIEAEAIAPARHTGRIPVAALLFHAGRSHVVAHRGPAERELLDRGALHVGMVTFDGTAPPFSASARIQVGGFTGLGGWGSGRN